MSGAGAATLSPGVRPAGRRRDGAARPAAAWRTRFAALALCLLAALVAPRALASEPGPGVDELTDAFLRIVGLGEFGAPVPGIVRWEDAPLDLALVGRPEPDQVAALEALLPRIASATGLPMQVVPPLAVPARGPAAGGLELGLANPRTHFRMFGNMPAGDPFPYVLHGRDGHVQAWRAGMTVVFGVHEDLRRLSRMLNVDARLRGDIDAGTTPCFAFLSIDRVRSIIQYAVVGLRTDIPDWARRRCVHEEVTQSMGLRNDLPGSDISLFDEAMMRGRTELTRHDWMFLEILYDRSLPPGLHGIELRRRARPLVEQHLRRRRD